MEKPRPVPRYYQKLAVAPRHRGDLPRPFARRRRSRLTSQFSSAASREPDTQARRSLVSSSAGAIETLLLSVPRISIDHGEVSALYRELLDALPAATRFVIVTNDDRGDLAAWPEVVSRGGSVQIVRTSVHVNFTDWAEDPYVVVSDLERERSSLVEPFEFRRYADSLVADYVSDATDFGDGQALLYFEGGNLLIGDTFFLVGQDYLTRTTEYIPEVIRPSANESDLELVERLFREGLDTERQLIPVASSEQVPVQRYEVLQDDSGPFVEAHFISNTEGTVQPLFHIDMFVTLVGRDRPGSPFRILVGDPKMAAETLGEELRPEAMQKQFKSIAGHLEAEGFDVHRNPLPYRYVSERVSREAFAVDAPEVTEELERLGVAEVEFFKWFFATANNALVQDTGAGSRRVWLPTYGHDAWPELAATDRQNREIWEKDLGYAVTELGDYTPFAELSGSVHCISKYLART